MLNTTTARRMRAPIALAAAMAVLSTTVIGAWTTPAAAAVGAPEVAIRQTPEQLDPGPLVGAAPRGHRIQRPDRQRLVLRLCGGEREHEEHPLRAAEELIARHAVLARSLLQERPDVLVGHGLVQRLSRNGAGRNCAC